MIRSTGRAILIIVQQKETVKQRSAEPVFEARNDEPFSDATGDRFMFWTTLVTGILFVAMLYFVFGIGRR